MIASIGRRLRNENGRDRGITLVELMVTTAITSLVAILTATLVIGVQRTNQESLARQNQIDEARVAVEAMAKSLRASVKPSQVAVACTGCVEDAFVQGTAQSVQFYSNLNNANNVTGPSRVTYTIVTTGSNAGDLVEVIQRPNSNIPSATGYSYCTEGSPGCSSNIARRVVARGVVYDGAPVLRYFDGEGNEMVPPTGGSLTGAQLKMLLAVELQVSVRTETGAAPQPTTYIQRLMLPNAQAVMKAGS